MLGIKNNMPLDRISILSHASEGRAARVYAKGENVYLQGEAADALYYIQSGKVRISVVSERGKEAIIAVNGPDSFLGEGCLGGQAQRPSTASTLVASTILRMEVRAVTEAMRQNPDFSALIFTHLLGRIARLEADLLDQLFNSSEKRLARLLILLADYDKKSGSQPIILSVTQEMLAEMVGAHRTRVNFFMKKFRQLGLIDYDESHIEVRGGLLSTFLLERPLTNGELSSD